MSNNLIAKSFFLFFLNSFFLVFNSQLNSFFEDWEPRTFNPPSNTILKPTINSSSTVTININTSNVLADVLPSHFGTNLTHFLGESVINDNDFMSNIKNLGKSILRYPGGNGSNQFFWDGNIPSSILNDSEITVNDLIDGSGWRISPDDFLQILDSTNGKGIIAVNASYARYGSSVNPLQTAASYAANFVRHMNQTLGAYIKYWEVGNENYGSWQAGYIVNGDTIDGTKYGDIFNVFADSMKAADPTIKIGAVLFRQDGAYNDWSEKVLSKVENKADFLIIHNYFRRKPNPNNVTYQEMLTSLNQIQQDANRVKNMVANYTSKSRNYFPIAITEFNSKTGEREISMANAIFIAQALAEQIKNGFAASILWSFQNGLDSYGGDHGMTARNSPILNDHYPRPVFYIYHYFQKFMGDKMVWSYSSDSAVKSYATTFSTGQKGIVLVNNSAISKTVDLDFGSDTMSYNYYWYDVYANNETDKKIFVNGQTSNFIEGGPENYTSIPSYYRPVDGNNKFELKPYSVKFIANSDYLLNDNIIESDIDLILYPNPFDEIININQEYNYDYLKIFDINGKLVLQSSKESINTKFLKEGIYILKLFNSQSSSQFKIIKVKK